MSAHVISFSKVESSRAAGVAPTGQRLFLSSLCRESLPAQAGAVLLLLFGASPVLVACAALLGAR